MYRRGDQLEREGDPARWLAYVTEGCFKYVTHGPSDDREHITWSSFEGEFVVDYPTFLYARPAQATIVAMMPSRVLRVTGEQMSPPRPSARFAATSRLTAENSKKQQKLFT